MPYCLQTTFSGHRSYDSALELSVLSPNISRTHNSCQMCTPPGTHGVTVAACVLKALLPCYCNLILENSKPEDNSGLNRICVFNQVADVIDYVIIPFSA